MVISNSGYADAIVLRYSSTVVDNGIAMPDHVSQEKASMVTEPRPELLRAFEATIAIRLF